MPPVAGNIRNIGIFAHVDTGKTTLTERILFHSGAIRQQGSVDSGTAHTDTLPVEQRRGISVKATGVSFTWNDVTFNLIDTPGHADFSSEIERSLWALDGAILLVDAVDGVQPQTEVLFRAMKEQSMPFLFFLNKCDRDGASQQNTLKQIKTLLTQDAAMADDLDGLTELVCAHDDKLLETYLEGGHLPEELLLRRFAALAAAGTIHPVLSGSALKDQGVPELLDAAVDFLPPPPICGTGLCGVVFTSFQDKTMGRGLEVRIFSGKLENRMEIETGKDSGGKPVLHKITQIRDQAGKDAGALEAGMTGAIFGLGDLPIGHVFGDAALLPRNITPGMLREPLIRVSITPDKPENMHALRAACRQLAEEDPMLQVTYLKSLDQLQMSLMGMVQLEVMEEILQTRFGITAAFSEPSVIYKETVQKTATGFIDYTMPKPCWAIMTFRVDPAPRGSGVTFVSEVPFKDIMAKYQHQVQDTIPRALKQGRLGWEVTDVKITLISGEHHLEHTHPLDFVVATPMGIQNALHNAGSVLLEPILDATFIIPAENVGRVISDISTMRGEVTGTETMENRVTLKAMLPVSTSLKYATTLAMITGGKGAMNVRLHGYRECPVELGATAPRRSADPLDKARYILVIRNAIEDELFSE